MVNSHDPHRPYCNPEKLTKGAAMPSRVYKPEEVDVPGFLPDLPGVRAELATYLNSTRRLDDTFGKVMQALKESGEADNTLVLFITDNGIGRSVREMQRMVPQLSKPPAGSLARNHQARYSRRQSLCVRRRFLSDVSGRYEE